MALKKRMINNFYNNYNNYYSHNDEINKILDCIKNDYSKNHSKRESSFNYRTDENNI